MNTQDQLEAVQSMIRDGRVPKGEEWGVTVGEMDLMAELALENTPNDAIIKQADEMLTHPSGSDHTN